MKQLRVQVERVVRPIRAFHRRKDKMREELLAHITAAYEQELACLDDSRVAAERAIRRFGDPAELRRELQASVPAVERILCIRPPCRIIERFEERYLEKEILYKTKFMALLCFFGIVVQGCLIGLAAHWLTGVSPDYREVFTICFGMGGALSVALILTSLVARGMRHALCGEDGASRSALGAFGYMLLMGLGVACLGIALSVIIKPYLLFDKCHLLMLLAAAVVCPAVTAFVVVVDERDLRRFHEWGKLEIEE